MGLEYEGLACISGLIHWWIGNLMALVEGVDIYRGAIVFGMSLLKGMSLRAMHCPEPLSRLLSASWFPSITE